MQSLPPLAQAMTCTVAPFAVIGAFVGIAWLVLPKCNRRWCWRLRPAGLHWCRECMDNHVMIAGSDESESLLHTLARGLTCCPECTAENPMRTGRDTSDGEEWRLFTCRVCGLRYGIRESAFAGSGWGDG